MRKIVTKILIYSTWIVAILLSIANLTIYISPEIFWPTAFLGLLFPFLLILTIALFFYWTIRLKKILILPVLALLISWNNVEHTFQIGGKKLSSKELTRSNQTELKILTYNVQIFKLLGNAHFGEEQHQMFREIKQEDPDIICFQEFYINAEKGLSLSKLNGLLAAYPYRHLYWINQSSAAKYGIVIYSKHPLIKRSSITFQKSHNASIFADIKIGNDTLRIFNSHLQSIKFNKNNYQFISNQSKYNQKEKIKALQDISGRLKKAFIKRAHQANMLSEQIQKSPYPVIVCGDFNDTPVSYTYRKIKGNLEDTFVHAGKGFGNTYVGKFPSYRIDFVFHSNEMGTKTFYTPRFKYSDHYPVFTEIVLK